MRELIEATLRRGCPNCHERSWLQRWRKANGPMATDGLTCTRCDITWEAEPIPFAELGGFPQSVYGENGA